MIRSLILIATLLACGAMTISYPYAGLLSWVWLSLMSPHQQVWGGLSSLSLNLYIALLTMVVWFFSLESKKLPNHPITWLICAFIFWLLMSQLFAVKPDYSREHFDIYIRALILVVLALAMVTDKIRVQALVWVIVIAVGYYAVRGGGFTILTGGGYRVFGPEKTQIYDNNHLAMAIVMIMPLCIYLYQHTASKYIRWALLGLTGLSVAAVLGTHSRGGFIALSVLFMVWWWKSRHKIISLLMMAMVSVPALMFMPDNWFERIETIQSADQDASFNARLEAWEVAVRAGLQNPVFGVGLRATYNEDVAAQYGAEYVKFRAVHSMYFEVLAGMGLIGFLIFVSILILAWWNAGKIRRQTRGQKDLRWMHDLATMIQISLAAFCVGAASVSLEMWEGYFLLIVMVVSMQKILQGQVNPSMAPSPPLRHSVAHQSDRHSRK